LVLNSHVRAADREPQLELGKVPQQLCVALQELYLWSGAESLLQIDNPDAAYTPDILPWASAAANNAYLDFGRMRDAFMDDKPAYQSYIARAGEIAVRLATIRAAGRWGLGAEIDRDDIDWATEIAWTAGLALADTAMNYMPGTDRQTWGDKILSLIRRRGPLKTREIQMHIRGAIRSSEIKDLLGQFGEAGLIEWTTDGYRAVTKWFV
jgi:hypothetical protein